MLRLHSGMLVQAAGLTHSLRLSRRGLPGRGRATLNAWGVCMGGGRATVREFALQSLKSALSHHMSLNRSSSHNRGPRPPRLGVKRAQAHGARREVRAAAAAADAAVRRHSRACQEICETAARGLGLGAHNCGPLSMSQRTTHLLKLANSSPVPP